jgi:DNA-binding Xre family transcriptional regulator
MTLAGPEAALQYLGCMGTHTLTSIVEGPIGTVSDFYELIGEKLKENATSWDDLARALGVSRQYITRVLREPKIPLERVRAVCDAVGLRVEDVIAPTTFVRSLCGSRRGPTGSSGGGVSTDADADLRDAEEQLDGVRVELRASWHRCAELERQLTSTIAELRSAELRRPAYNTTQSAHFSF